LGGLEESVSTAVARRGGVFGGVLPFRMHRQSSS
jgi:hypothetical protein